MSVSPETIQRIGDIFARLDYRALGRIYCDEGGDAFWEDRRQPCQQLGIAFSEVLMTRVQAGGRSLYVGAGVAEIPMLATETLELKREVTAVTLREDEVSALNRACLGFPFTFVHGDARSATGPFDHLWVVSVLSDPEHFPHASALSYGRANPVTFDPEEFARERRALFGLTAACMEKLSAPALVTTSVEEIPWITNWCDLREMDYVVEEQEYETAIVGDPICFIRISGSVPGTRTGRLPNPH